MNSCLRLSAVLLSLVCIGSLPAADSAAPSGSADEVYLRVTKKIDPVYPSRMIQEGVKHGEVRVVICIDREGQLSDALTTAYTHKAFADAAMEALKGWRFAPPQLQGRPTGAITEITFTYELNGVLSREVLGEPSETALRLYQGKYVYQPCPPNALDAALKPVQVVQPVYPKSLVDQKISDRVLVDFYIDESGKPRLPAASAGTNDVLAGAAVAAIEQWRFNPPTSKGQPVLVRATQAFVFSPPEK